MTNLEHPVHIFLKWCSSAAVAQVEVELVDGARRVMQGPGVLSSLFFSYSNFVHAVAGAVVSFVVTSRISR